MFNSICVVCIGNICRSPIGERLLSKTFPDKDITSAGIYAEVGCHAYPKSVQVAKAHGLSLDGHVARQLTRKICEQQDLILVMEKYHLNEVHRIATDMKGEVMLYGHWLQELEIADPYGKNVAAFEETYQLLEQASQAWGKKL